MGVAQVNRINEWHKPITQTNRTKQDDIMSMNGNDEQCFRMLQSNSGAYMEDLRLVDLIEYIKVEGVNASMLLVNALDG